MTSLRELCRTPAFPEAPDHAVSLGTTEVERRLPHRGPMRLLDRVTALDPAGGRALGHRWVDPDDPVLAGHFPGAPIYPGVLQLELMGQLGLCLSWERARLERGSEPDALDVRVVGVEQARFLAPLGPGELADVVALLVDEDPLRGRIAGQVRVGTRICSAALLEVYLA